MAGFVFRENHQPEVHRTPCSTPVPASVRTGTESGLSGHAARSASAASQPLVLWVRLTR